MNGPHDLGGQMGFGPVVPEPEDTEPVFHSRWESRSLALTLATGALGHWNIDRSRLARESIAPATYLASSYYEIWTIGLESLLIEQELITADEVEAGRSLYPAKPTKRSAMPAAAVSSSFASRVGFERPAVSPARFGAGDRVRTINDHRSGHTRLPLYARGKVGTVEVVRGCMVFPDANAQGLGPDPQWCYTIVFNADELWGNSAEARSTVSIDAFEPYLENV
jgi:nitrile hydratase subunit beta